jgi:type IV secretory pathway VirB10-like protein
VVNLSSALKRKDVLTVICVALAVIVMAGLVFSSVKTGRKSAAEDAAASAARTPDDFLRRERDRERNTAPPAAGEAGGGLPADNGAEPAAPAPAGLPEVVINPEDDRQGTATPPPPPQSRPSTGGGGGGSAPPPFTANQAPLVPPLIEGSVFGAAAGNAGQPPAAPAQPPGYAAAQNPAAAYPAYPAYQNPAAGNNYAAQNDQAGKQAFRDAGADGGGPLASGRFLGDNALWIGTIIPAVLETAVNTDLPGSVVARVTQNVYDTRTGGHLLIPQGTLLTARYNSSVSYAQRRVQIAWDTLTRPDGYHVELGGMNAVDERGMSGAAARYHENWFEYLKAAGVIALFSVANSKMAEEAARYGTQEMAAGVVQSNAELMNQLGGNIIGRAMDIQPTLTLDAGETINIMVNKNMFLPPVADYPVTQPYMLK